ncbi:MULTISPECIES: type II toxin-antitoxin system HipA family toxin [Thiorhodovibrio]|uniref:type II toxin-antitoxin system HipA family toxin n=1 Tax=Thiorhodovibrio TaxID=61593 RepID=UPI00191165E6|nr:MULTISPECIES: type II toxin-antitoxin system HipA family toxin [Thiorhodovibrio]MBK5969153.1 phosphatidylinositol kinase [Thiorhodovibrio winogradskyi]WPL13374.1 putative DNA-binding transcriptional regulator [Thiorhodovibrio litoralis]
MSAEHVNRLDVWRTFSDGSRCRVGVLAQNRQGVFFQYAGDYLARFANLSPFGLRFDASLQTAPRSPHAGLHGVFADSLPDGWGLLLMDRVFRQAEIAPAQVTALDRLAFVANRALGALSYEPPSSLQLAATDGRIDLGQLGLQAQALYDGQTTEVLAELVRVGSSGGARPKAQLYLSDTDNHNCATTPGPDRAAYLVKFTSASLPLGHEEGLCEAAYLTMAGQAGIEVANWRLLDAPAESGAKQWLAVERFDTNGPDGRLHLHSACGLLDADFRLPSLDYADLIKASSLLCQSPAVGQAQFRRAVFNLFALNQDDHSKNWAFLQDDQGHWRLSPFYDATFSPGPYGEHASAFAGFGKAPPRKAMQRLAAQANFAQWRQARAVIAEVVESISGFGEIAKGLGVRDDSIRLIQRQLEDVRRVNQGLLED